MLASSNNFAANDVYVFIEREIEHFSNTQLFIFLTHIAKSTRFSHFHRFVASNVQLLIHSKLSSKFTIQIQWPQTDLVSTHMVQSSCYGRERKKEERYTSNANIYSTTCAQKVWLSVLYCEILEMVTDIVDTILSIQSE